MKRLIVPILIGLVMFGAAFGGAFYFFRYQQTAAAAHMKDVVAEALGTLKEQGRVTVFSGRFVAVMPGRPAAAPDAPAGPALLVPGSVHYEIDLKRLRDQDVRWEERAGVLSVRLPALLLSDPGLDKAGIRQIGGGGAWIAPAGGEAMADAAARDAARAELLKQARAGDAMNLARDAARTLVQRVFAGALREEGVKAKIEMRFADEQADEGQADDGEAAGGTAEDLPIAATAPPAEAAVPAAGNVTEE